MVKRDVIGLVEHGSGMRAVGMTGGKVNINNGVSTNLVMPHVYMDGFYWPILGIHPSVQSNNTHLVGSVKFLIG